MNAPNTGGPAFPTTVYTNESFQGMTLRDYFAAKAMQAEISANDWGGEIEATAFMAYKVADAMLKARES